MSHSGSSLAFQGPGGRGHTDGHRSSRRGRPSRPQDAPGGPGPRALSSSASGPGLTPGWEAKTPHALRPKTQNKIDTML